MSTERWNDERLDRLANRIESVIESNARIIQALANASAEAREERQQLFESAQRHDRLIESNARVIQALANASAEAREDWQQQQAIILQHQEEIRGLQTENRRILDILLNQQNQGEDSTDD
ncbi:MULTISPECIES: hypothetical protein [unclassified Roseofilum]|uniref:hypothetical protein n=1 Tax=unclassified Roseofilum TaxID=2620099 RepID=UPI000E7EC94D|nr:MULTISPECIES: hypothetical protein [unclassified Roseofilum]MBP0009940.1 hypothetical protein [Roseofilum sp. Belize Diploria]MBP0034078.1 hypothetical protein [Roseofilum sp. Belize BBD 4]HBQ99278.1 hypothetical protein [Cyanobacteria bacterium UBA11691]